ncbi:Ivy family C-type lysozyme inhibitor [Cronobacter sakazakii]|nr:Ivy family C-type lysozyme inhibitor [Cronobacter sakazakii]
MKKTLIALFFSLSGLATTAYAQDDLSIKQLATDKSTEAEYQKMVEGQHLPKWVAQGGTTSPARSVKLGDKEYMVLTACKQHECATQRIAVLYSPETKMMTGLFSTVDEHSGNETLQWLNIPDELSINGKTVLYAALSGSLENHPDNFNFK